MTFDDEEHQVKRTLDDEPTPASNTTKKQSQKPADESANTQETTNESDAKNKSATSVDARLNSDEHGKNSVGDDTNNAPTNAIEKNQEDAQEDSSKSDASARKQSSKAHDEDAIANYNKTDKDNENLGGETDTNTEADKEREGSSENTDTGSKTDKDNENTEANSESESESENTDATGGTGIGSKKYYENISENIDEDADKGEAFIPPSQAPQEEAKDEDPMTLLDHLSELRRRLTRIVIVVIIGFFGFYGVSEMAYAYLAIPLTTQLPEGSTLIYTSPQGAFFTYLKVSLMLSLLGTSPFTFYQIWAFIAPGLYKEEQQAITPLAFFSALFFLSGAAFCYFAVFPVAFKFFIGFTSDIVVPMISVEEYLSFALKLIIAFGLVFEMPLFSYFLAKLRIITPEGMRTYRKYAVLAIFVVAAILTPPDVFSQMLMAMPMLLLYEISIYVAQVARGKSVAPPKNDEEKDEEDADKINNFK